MSQFISLALLFLSLSLHAQTYESVGERITQAFNKRVTNDLLIGASVGYMDEQGTLELSLGTVDNAHEKFEIGSISKSFTGIIIAQLVLENKLKLSTLLEEVIPELSGTFAGSISIKLLATHRSQLIRSHPDGWNISEKSIINFLATYAPGPTTPAEGEKRYSNLGFAVLGVVISKITQQSYSYAVRERIFRPLGMNESGFLLSSDEHLSLVTPHDPLLRQISADILSEVASASGGITSSLHDMMKFLRANFNPDEAVKLAQKEGLGFDHSTEDNYLWKNGGMAGFSSLMLIDTAARKATIVLVNAYNYLSVEHLALIALGKKDNYKPDKMVELTFSSEVVGRYFCSEFSLYMNVVTTKKGFLGFEYSYNADGSESWATRLITDDLKKFFLFGSGADKDYIEFRQNPETGKKEAILHEFEKDQNGDLNHFENTFIEVDEVPAS